MRSWARRGSCRIGTCPASLPSRHVPVPGTWTCLAQTEEARRRRRQAVPAPRASSSACNVELRQRTVAAIDGVRAASCRGSVPRMRVDLRSDTVTQPTAGMRAAIAAAEVGDEQKREDPTVNTLERRGAELLGKDAAVYLPTATMANQIALHLHARPGDELYAEATSHVLIAELGGPALHSGLMARPLDHPDGIFTPDDLRAAIRPSIGPHVPRPRVVVVENTHNSSGGRVWTLAQVEAITAAARELELRTHLDGARILNAATAVGVAAAGLCKPFDTVTLCLSKGLGCPLGAL